MRFRARPLNPRHSESSDVHACHHDKVRRTDGAQLAQRLICGLGCRGLEFRSVGSRFVVAVGEPNMPHVDSSGAETSQRAQHYDHHHHHRELVCSCDTHDE